jgi:hypothetical protein
MAEYEEYAAQCVRQAQASSAPEIRAFLLMMAQAWLRLAENAKQARSLAGKIEDEQRVAHLKATPSARRRKPHLTRRRPPGGERRGSS